MPGYILRGKYIPVYLNQLIMVIVGKKLSHHLMILKYMQFILQKKIIYGLAQIFRIGFIDLQMTDNSGK